MKSQLKRRVSKPARLELVAAKTPARRKWDWRPLLAGCLLVVLSILPYVNSLQNGFVWDDHQQIVMNRDLRPGADWSHLFSAGVWGYLHRGSAGSNIYYRPLQMATYRTIIETAGVSPLAFHLVSLMFAAASVLLAFGFFWKATRHIGIAFAAAALFAVHPIRSEAVDWIAALPDIGCTLFLLASFVFFLFIYGESSAESRTATPASRRSPLWIASVACFATALLWKETAAVFPLLVAAYVLLVSRPGETNKRVKAAALLSLPFWIVLAGYLLLRSRLLGVIAASQRNWQLTPLQLALTIPYLLMKYWRKLLVPTPLNAYHVFTPIGSLFETRALAGILFLVVACVCMVYATRRKPLIAFSAAWVFLTLLPVLDIYAVGRNVFAERYLYLPSVGFCLLVTLLAVEGLERVPKSFRKPISISAMALVVLFCSWVTMIRNRDWKDDATLFARTLEISPNAPFAHVMVAAAESEHPSSSASAEEHYWKAANYAASETPPDRLQMAIAYKGLASIYGERTDISRALEMLGRAREAAPDDPEVDGEQGLILTRAGRWDEAATYLQKAITTSPDDANVLNALGIYAQRRSRRLDQAAGYFQQALEVHPDRDGFRASVHNNLGTVFGEQGQYPDAVEQFKSAITIAPDDLEYRTNLATALAASRRYEEARAELRAVLAIDPNYEAARAVLVQLGGQ